MNIEEYKELTNCIIDLKTLINLDKRAEKDLKENTHEIEREGILTIIREFIRLKNDYEDLEDFSKKLQATKDRLDSYDKANTLIIERQQKEIEELKNGNIDFWISDREIEVRIKNKFISKDKIKAKIEEYKKLINECPMNDEEIFCKECTEKCGFNQTIDILQSLLEKE